MDCLSSDWLFDNEVLGSNFTPHSPPQLNFLPLSQLCFILPSHSHHSALYSYSLLYLSVMGTGPNPAWINHNFGGDFFSESAALAGVQQSLFLSCSLLLSLALSIFTTFLLFRLFAYINIGIYQVQQQQLQLLQPQQLAPQGRIHATESATYAHNDVADLVLNPPAAPAAGGEAPLME